MHVLPLARAGLWTSAVLGLAHSVLQPRSLSGLSLGILGSDPFGGPTAEQMRDSLDFSAIKLCSWVGGREYEHFSVRWAVQSGAFEAELLPSYPERPALTNPPKPLMRWRKCL